MFVTYHPADGDEQDWEFDHRQVRATEAVLIQKRFGGDRSYDQWVLGVRQGDVEARRVLLWHLLRRDHHTLRWDDTPDFLVGELEVRHNLAELQELREVVAKANLSDEEREQVLRALDLEITEAIEDSESGKATSSSGGDATGSPSPSSPVSARASRKNS